MTFCKENVLACNPPDPKRLWLEGKFVNTTIFNYNILHIF